MRIVLTLLILLAVGCSPNGNTITRMTCVDLHNSYFKILNDPYGNEAATVSGEAMAAEDAKLSDLGNHYHGISTIQAMRARCAALGFPS